MPNASQQRGISRALLALSLLGMVVIQFAAFWKVHDQITRGKPDFAGFYAAGATVLKGHGSRVYDMDAQRAAQTAFMAAAGRQNPLVFVHPPFELPLFAGLALLPYHAAFFLWYACNLSMLAGSMWVLRPALPHLAAHFPWVLLLAGAFVPTFAATIHGQDSILFMLLLALAFRLLQDGRELRAGWCIAAAAFKFQLVVPIAILLLAARYWRVIKGMIQGGFVLLAAAVLLVGWHGLLQYPILLRDFDRLPAGATAAYVQDMATVRGFFYGLFGTMAPRAILNVASLMVWVAAIVLLARMDLAERKLFPLRFSLALAGIAAASYYLYLHDFTFLLIPLSVVSEYLMEHRLNTITRKLLAISAALVFLSPKLLPSISGAQILFTALVAFVSLLSVEIHAAKTASCVSVAASR